MSENDRKDDAQLPVAVQVEIRWLETRCAIEEFLNPDSGLPPELRERELVDLQALIGKALQQLREKKRAR